MEFPRIPSGIDELDAVLDGGVPKGSVIALIGKPGDGKERIGFEILKAGLDHDEKCLVITTNYNAQQIVDIARNIDIDLANALFLDGAQWRVQRLNPKYTSLAKYSVKNLYDLNSLLAKILDVCKENDGLSRILFDTPSSLLLYSTPGPEQVFRFFEMLTAFTRSKSISLFYTLDESMHTPEIVSTMKFLSDGSLLVSRNSNSITIQIESILFDKPQQSEINLS